MCTSAIIQSKYSNRVYFDCTTKLCIIVPGKQESFYLQGILNDINDENTSFLDCKQKHTITCEAPPDKVGVLLRLLLIEFNGFTVKQN